MSAPPKSRTTVKAVRPRHCIPLPRRADQRLIKGEGFASFLRRSTSPVARRIRRFVNGNLAKLPPDARAGICRGINSPRFHQANLELIVGRTFQELGATRLDYERLQPNGKRPDFLATFEDASVFVDATHPAWNADLERRHHANQRLLDVIESVIPPGWSFAANRLPRIGLSSPIGAFRRAVVTSFASLPIASGPEQIQVQSSDPDLRFKLELWAPRRSTERAWLAGPGVAEFIATELQIREAVRKKRDQLRGLPHPAIVAIGGALGGALDDFDIALFGRTVGYIDASGKERPGQFERSGLFAKLGGSTPTIAGVFAYIGMDVTAGNDPILYLHPRFTGVLPRALMALRVRRLGSNGPEMTPASVSGIFDRLSQTLSGR